MEKKIYFRHCIIPSNDQNKVENEVNAIYNDKYSEVISMTITPIRLNHEHVDENKLDELAVEYCKLLPYSSNSKEYYASKEDFKAGYRKAKEE